MSPSSRQRPHRRRSRQDFRKPYRRAAGTAKPSSAPVLSVRDGLALCQLSGICTVAYTGGAPALGYDMLAADASGGIKTTEAGGRTVLVTAVDSTAMTAEILL